MQTVINLTKEVINPLITLLFAFALIYFLWGLISFLAGRDDASKMEAGKKHMVWGLIGLVVMTGAIGIMNVMVSLINQVAPP